jgi:tetratricopeptide (TPR) repeat protein
VKGRSALGTLLVLTAGFGEAVADEGIPRHGARIERPAPIPDPGALEPGVLASYRARSEALDRVLADPLATREALGDACGALGMWLHVYRYFERAHLPYRCAEAMLPSDPRWPYHRAALFVREGAVDQARAALERTLLLRPEYLPALIRLSDLEVKAGRPDRGERLVGRILDADPENPIALTLLGRIAVSDGRFEEARAWLERSLERSPDVPETHYLLARAYRNLGDAAAARRHLEASRVDDRAPRWGTLSDPYRAELERVESGAAWQMERGRALLAAGRAQEAVPYYRRAVEASPEDWTARINLGGALQRAGDLEGATAVFQQIVATHPSPPPHPELALAHFNLGVVLDASGRSAEAELSYRRSLDSDPEQLAANRELGRLLARLGRNEEALSHFAIAAARDPADPGVRFDRVVAQIRLGDFERAATQAEEDLGVLPDQQALMLILARLRAASPDDSVRSGGQAVALARRIAPRSALVVAETLAMVAAEAGRFDEAVRWQSAALAAVRDQGLSAMEPRVAGRLSRYERRMPNREVWLSEESDAVRIHVELPDSRRATPEGGG